MRPKRYILVKHTVTRINTESTPFQNKSLKSFVDLSRLGFITFFIALNAINRVPSMLVAGGESVIAC